MHLKERNARVSDFCFKSYSIPVVFYNLNKKQTSEEGECFFNNNTSKKPGLDNKFILSTLLLVVLDNKWALCRYATKKKLSLTKLNHKSSTY